MVMRDIASLERIAAERPAHKASPVRGPLSIREMLVAAGLRPTRQRLALAALIFEGGKRHISADELLERAVLAQVYVAFGTIYNTLRQLTEAGLLREIKVDGVGTCYDTDTSEHHHFVVEGDNTLIDIPPGPAGLGRLPEPPPGYEIAGVVVRLRRNAA
jgi:Fur family iron response transcriptional regulator